MPSWLSDARQEARNFDVSERPRGHDALEEQYQAEKARFIELAKMHGIDINLTSAEEQGLIVKIRSIGQSRNAPGNLFYQAWFEGIYAKTSSVCITWIIIDPYTEERMTLSMGFTVTKEYLPYNPNHPLNLEKDGRSYFVWRHTPTMNQEQIEAQIRSWLVNVYRRNPGM